MMNRLCTTGPHLEKLSQLRAKTDRQLLGLIQSKLDFSLRFAVLAGVEQSAGNRASAEQSLGHANQAISEVQRLLPTLSAEQRRWLEPKLNEVRESVERIRQIPRTLRASVA